MFYKAVWVWSGAILVSMQAARKALDFVNRSANHLVYNGE